MSLLEKITERQAGQVAKGHPASAELDGQSADELLEIAMQGLDRGSALLAAAADKASTTEKQDPDTVAILENAMREVANAKNLQVLDTPQLAVGQSVVQVERQIDGTKNRPEAHRELSLYNKVMWNFFRTLLSVNPGPLKKEAMELALLSHRQEIAIRNGGKDIDPAVWIAKTTKLFEETSLHAPIAPIKNAYLEVVKNPSSNYEAFLKIYNKDLSVQAQRWILDMCSLEMERVIRAVNSFHANEKLKEEIHNAIELVAGDREGNDIKAMLRTVMKLAGIELPD